METELASARQMCEANADDLTQVKLQFAEADSKLRQAQLRETQSRAQHDAVRREIAMLKQQIQHYQSDSASQKQENQQLRQRMLDMVRRQNSCGVRSATPKQGPEVEAAAITQLKEEKQRREHEHAQVVSTLKLQHEALLMERDSEVKKLRQVNKQIAEELEAVKDRNAALEFQSKQREQELLGKIAQLRQQYMSVPAEQPQERHKEPSPSSVVAAENTAPPRPVVSQIAPRVV